MSRGVIVFGASGGLGRVLLEQLAESGGYELYGTAHTGRQNLAETLEKIGRDPQRHGFQLDATEYQAVADCVSRVAEQTELWAIVNLVGVPTAARLSRATPDQIRDALLTNVLPALWTTKAMFESHRATGRSGGRLVHPSSVVVRRPVPGTAPYAAAKGSVETLVRSAAEEGARLGVTINALRLGYFAAGMSAGVPEAVRTQVEAATPMGRLGSPEDLGAVVGFLLDEASGFVTGATLDVDGGLT